METIITIDDLKGLFRRRAKLFFTIFTIIFLLAMTITIMLPPLYKSQAVILIESQQIPADYVQSSITSYAEQRLDTITREIIQFEALKEIIKEFNLYPEDIKNNDLNSAAAKMKEAVVVEPISSKAGTQSVTVAFTLSYEGEDPQKTYETTDRLSKLYLEKESQTRQSQAEATTGFLEKELANLKKQITDQEKLISEFKERHIKELPGSAATNLSSLQRMERELEQTNLQIRSLQDRKVYLNGQLASVDPLKPIQTETGQEASNPQERLKSLRLELIRARSRLSDKHPDIRKLTSEIEELERQVGQSDGSIAKVKQLNALRTKLKELQGSKGEKHPDVIALTKQVALLSKDVDEILARSAATDYSKSKPDNPAYINLMTQITSTDLEIKGLQEDIVKIEEYIAEYQRRVENAPSVEREYNDLTIDYQNAKKRYNDISEKLLQARVAQEMEVQQHGEHFTITEPPFVPTKPSKPNRIAIMLLGFVLALGGGMGVAAFKEATDHTIKNSKEIIGFEGVDLLTAMPYASTKEERNQKRNRKLALTMGCIGILGVLLAVVDRLVYPLSNLFSVIFERLAF